MKIEDFKGTKGKWIVKDIREPNPFNEQCGCHSVMLENHNAYGMIDIWFSDVHQTKTAEEALANAHLIASAPELLEALLSIENDNGSIPKKIWDMRNKAIAKAIGEDCDGESLIEY